MSTIIYILFTLFAFEKSLAQLQVSSAVSITLPKVALLAIHPVSTITFTFIAPTNAGNPLTNH